jgi:hypothetical protein
MPKSNVVISATLREALFECFRATTRLVRPSLRRQLVLVGGTASIAHSSVFKIEDVDVAGPPSVLIDIWAAVSAGALNFNLEPDGKITFDAPQGFIVRVDLISISDGCIERIHVAEPSKKGSVASKSDLLRLRAVTVVDRGSDGEVDDFRWLLSEVAREGRILPALDGDELDYLSGAGACLGRLDRSVFAAVLGGYNRDIAMKFCYKIKKLNQIRIALPLLTLCQLGMASELEGHRHLQWQHSQKVYVLHFLTDVRCQYNDS